MLFRIKATVQIKKKKKGTFKPFNPLTYDAGNLLALYDGDTLATDPPATWTDQSANGYDLTLFNAPAIVNLAINGHDALRFDGVNQYGERIGTPALNVPTTFYVVFKQMTWTLNDFVFCSRSFNAKNIVQNPLTPDLNMDSSLIANPQIPLNNYDIITANFNGLNSELRINNNAAVIGATTLTNETGLVIASVFHTLSNYLNGEFAYIIIRSAADNTATQNLFINYLKNRFAI